MRTAEGDRKGLQANRDKLGRAMDKARRKLIEEIERKVKDVIKMELELKLNE